MFKLLQKFKYEILKPLVKDTRILDAIWWIRKWYHLVINDKLGKGMFYDKCTIKLLSRLPLNSNCIDVGANRGLILKEILRAHPKGNHYAFEPIAELYKKLKHTYPQVSVVNCALSDQVGRSEFYYLNSAPELSGLKFRTSLDGYEHIPSKRIIETSTLDSQIPENSKIKFIKIDVEGAEFSVLKGAKKLIIRDRPLVIFEFEKLACKEYKIDPSIVYDYITLELNMRITFIAEYLKNTGRSLSSDEFLSEYFSEGEFYFLAYPNN